MAKENTVRFKLKAKDKSEKKNPRKLKIEVIEVYLTTIDKSLRYIKGTMHIYIENDQLDIRGINVRFHKERWLIWLPEAYSKDEETGVPVKYPIPSYASNWKQAQLLSFLKKEAVQYMQANYGNMFDAMDKSSG
jgi:hypothetical protein